MPSAATEPAAAVVSKRGLIPDWLVVGLALALVAALATPRLPHGICFGDSGDLQLAAATLGMTHPPGYGGYASLGHLLTLIPGLEPAYAVTLGCLASGLIALAFIAALQIRLGANAWLAAAVMLGLAGCTRIWEALTIPEVYAPNLALHAAAVWFFVKYVQTERLRWWALVALLLGFAAANRPSALLSVPGFALALFLYWRQNPSARRMWLAVAAIGLACLLAPCLYTVAYYYIRDSSGTPLNVIENWRMMHGTLPAATAGPAAKLERALWLATAREYRDLVGGSWAFMASRGHWLIERLELSKDLPMIAATCAAVIGGAVAWRRCRSVAIVLTGIALGAAAFFCVYEVYDSAADVLPIMLAGAVFIGLCASVIFPPKPAFATPTLGILAFVAAALWTGFRASQPVPEAKGLEATQFVEAAELWKLPRSAAVLTEWVKVPPLRYAQYRLNRPDLLIMTPNLDHRRELVARLSDGGRGRAVFSTAQFEPPPGYEITCWGELWYVKPVGIAATQADRPVAPKRNGGVSEGAQKQQ